MIKMQNYMTVDLETGEKSYSALPKGVELPTGAIPVDKQPKGQFVSHCATTGKLLTDHAAAADAVASPQAIAAAHASKVLEARLYIKGIEVEGYLAAEAKALKIPIADLVAIVLQKAEAAIASETERRVNKAKGLQAS